MTSHSLPERPSMTWLRKAAKDRLRVLRAHDPSARLADAQFALAHNYGFESWRALKAHVDAREMGVAEERVAQFLRLVGNGTIDEVRAALAQDPSLATAVGPHPFWGGRPQALHVAIETNRRDIFDVLLQAGADVNGKNDEYDHWSPLMIAANPKSAEMRAELLRRGAHIGLPEALLLADDASVERLLRNATALPEPVPNGGSYLALARTIFAIDFLLARGASATMKDHWGTTPIESISRIGAQAQLLVEHLTARGLNVRPQEFARLGDRRTLEALIATDPRVAKNDGVFTSAVESGHRELVTWLLEKGANVNARDDSRSHGTALHLAAWNGDMSMVRLLVDAGADVAARDEEFRETPQGWAEASLRITKNPKCRDVVDCLASCSAPDPG